MGVGGSILHSVWKQDHYQHLKREEDDRQQIYQSAFSKRNKNDNRTEEEFFESLFPQPVLCTVQYTYYLEHLQSLPEREQAKGNLQYIRLINKRKLLRSPVIHWLIKQYLEVLFNFECIISKKSENGNPSSPTSNLADYLPSVSTTHQSRSLLYQEYEYRSGLKARDAYNVYQNIHEDIETTRRALERIFLWRSPKHHYYSDSFCELYPLSDCPKFTYISHRWLEDGTNPFGLHNELIIFLLLAKEDYLWYDATCIPQQESRNRNDRKRGEAEEEDDEHYQQIVKLIWNCGKILSSASNLATYYAVDGWKTGLLPPPGTSNGLNSTSIGFLRLYQCLFGSILPERIHQEISELQTDGWQRLWCYFERYYLSTTANYPSHVILTPSEFQSSMILSPFFRDRFRQKAKHLQAIELLSTSSTSSKRQEYLGRDSHQSVISTEDMIRRGSNQSVVDTTSILVSFHDHRRFHAERIFSLNCSSRHDLYPVTALLYEEKLLPFQFQKSQFLCQVMKGGRKGTEGISGNSIQFNWICGFHLPEISLLNKESSSQPSSGKKKNMNTTTTTSGTTAAAVINRIKHSYGWYRCPYYDEDKEKERARYYFALHTSQLFTSPSNNTHANSTHTASTTTTIASDYHPHGERVPTHDYLVLMFHEDCYHYVSQYYQCDCLTYPASDLQQFFKFFERYAIAYEWEYYHRSYCQLCRVKEQIEYDVENGTLLPANDMSNDASFDQPDDQTMKYSHHTSRPSLSEQGIGISLPYDRR